jgi:hypothetical protein
VLRKFFRHDRPALPGGIVDEEVVHPLGKVVPVRSRRCLVSFSSSVQSFVFQQVRQVVFSSYRRDGGYMGIPEQILENIAEFCKQEARSCQSGRMLV